MKKNFKKVLTVALSATMAMSCLAATGCGGKGKGGTEGTLNIYVLRKGYGTDWCDAIIEKFKEQDWVKEKYPNLKIETTYMPDDRQTEQEMNKGSVSKFDILFSQYTQGYSGNVNVLDITDSVYNSQVPGESIKVKEKLVDGFLEANSFKNELGETRQSTFSYVNGMYGILYNADLLEELNFEVPVTTDEFLDIMQTVKEWNGTNDKYKYTYSIANRANGYCFPMFSTWWAQYEGKAGYENFYKGKVGPETSKNVLKQQGRLESLEVLENLYKKSNGYLHPDAQKAELEAWLVQREFMSGQGLFHFNGDYFTTEMELYKEDILADGYDYEIRFMKNPVISSIVERLTSVKVAATAKGISNDEMLALLVRDIDNNEATCKYLADGVTAEDYDALKEARNMVNSSTVQAGMIPVWSKNQEIAIDFLRFMATDIACEAVIEKTKGLSMPFDYDVKTANKELYDTLDPVHQVKIDVYTNKLIPVTIVKEYSSFALGRAGLTPLASIMHNNKVAFESVFGAEGKTAQEIYQDDINYWNDARWADLLSKA